jgi:anaerobic selenocysteine-containing dehydrogenase
MKARQKTGSDSAARKTTPGEVNTLWRLWNGPSTEDLRLTESNSGLGHLPARLHPETTTRTICGFCSTGCSLDVHLQKGRAVNLSPTLKYPVNLGMACPKGWEALAPLSAPDRATTPMLRRDDGSLRPASWDTAMKTFVTRFRQTISEHGPESVAFLSTGQICTEEMALLGALWKFGMGALHCDSNTRQCMATAHVAYKQSFGFDAPPFTYADFEAGDVLVFVGANPCIAHPILWQRVMRNPNRPQIIVIDPRRTETAMNAEQHLALKPKSDLTLLYGVANLLVQNGWIDRDFIARNTNGFAGFADFVRSFTPDKVAGETGLTVGQIYRFAQAIHDGKVVSFWWTMGVNQCHEATRTAQAVINLSLMTGNIGRPGTGANSITGQCNAMGSRLFSNITGLYAGRDFRSSADREAVARTLNIPSERIPTRNSWAYDQVVEAIDEGRIKALWVIATNAAHSWINQRRFASVLKKLDFLVVQDLYTTTETAQLAHLLLPAAGWGEKEGTFINSERRIGLVKKVTRAPGIALSDFDIFRLIAHYWGCAEMFEEWSSPEATFQILKKLSAGQPCDITGISNYRHIEESGGIQWPFTEHDASSSQEAKGSFQERRLFADGRFFHPDGKARFYFDTPRPVSEPADTEFPFVLLTGRGTSAQWHTNTRTGKSAVLRTLYPNNAFVEVNPADAERLGVQPNGPVAVTSRRGRIECSAFVTPTVQAGQLFMPMHYQVTNQLTREDFDPHSRQPSYKHCAVRLEALARK